MRISEYISRLAASDSKRDVAQVFAMFPECVFGLLMNGVPKGQPVKKLVVDGTGTITMQYVVDPRGKRMIKACADPEVFDVNFPGSINVTMTGRELLEMAEKLTEADGILICSALSFHSFPIYKQTYPVLKTAKNFSRKWWQFWKSA